MLKISSLLELPIVLFIFNRISPLDLVFDIIREIKPPKLYIVADGPRKEFLLDFEMTSNARRITENIDWECSVQRKYFPENIGFPDVFQIGLDWVFEANEYALILEDDVIIDKSFYSLSRFIISNQRLYSSRIGVISSMNILGSYDINGNSYFYSNHCNTWGWATSREFWNLYHKSDELWKIKSNRKFVFKILLNQMNYWQAQYRMYLWKRTFNNQIDAWDYRIDFARYFYKFVSIVPSRNLSLNLGFNNEATHTYDLPYFLSKLELQSIEDFKLNNDIVVARNFDYSYSDLMYPYKSLRVYVLYLMKFKIKKLAYKIFGVKKKL